MQIKVVPLGKVSFSFCRISFSILAALNSIFLRLSLIFDYIIGAGQGISQFFLNFIERSFFVGERSFNA